MVETELSVEGMMCGMCEAHVNDAIKNNFRVKRVTSSHKKGKTVIVSDSGLDEEELKKIIAETGYNLLDVTAREKKKKRIFGK